MLAAVGQISDDAAGPALELGLEALGLSPPAERIEALLLYAAEIARWTRRVDLTGARGAEEIVRGPLFDALTLIPVLEPSGELLDVGSGAGLPGIPAAVLRPGIRVTLSEPRARRAAFLRHAVHSLAIEAEIVEARDDALGERRWDGAVAQAVWEPATWLSRALGLVRPGGAAYVLSSGPLAPGDLPEGLDVEADLSFSRPFDGAPRRAVRARLSEDR